LTRSCSRCADGYGHWISPAFQPAGSTLHDSVVANPESPGLLGLHQSVLVDPFFLFFAALFLAATALVIVLSVRYLEITGEKRGAYYALSTHSQAHAVSEVVAAVAVEVTGAEPRNK